MWFVVTLLAPSYCPGGPDSDFEYSTQSYTGYEPTSMRAIRARYDPYEQARQRIRQLESLGHDVDKVYKFCHSSNDSPLLLLDRIHCYGRDLYVSTRRLSGLLYSKLA